MSQDIYSAIISLTNTTTLWYDERMKDRVCISIEPNVLRVVDKWVDQSGLNRSQVVSELIMSQSWSVLTWTPIGWRFQWSGSEDAK